MHANAPVKLIKRSNLGIIKAERPEKITIKLRIKMFFKYGYLSFGLGSALKQLVASVI